MLAARAGLLEPSREAPHWQRFMTGAREAHGHRSAWASVSPLAQVDGPSHFSYNTWKVDGSTALKRRLLSRQGWTVISVSFFEWDMILPWKRAVSGAADHAASLRLSH